MVVAGHEIKGLQGNCDKGVLAFPRSEFASPSHEIKGREGNCDFTRNVSSHEANCLCQEIKGRERNCDKNAMRAGQRCLSMPSSRDQRPRRELRRADQKRVGGRRAGDVTRSKVAKGIASQRHKLGCKGHVFGIHSRDQRPLRRLQLVGCRRHHIDGLAENRHEIKGREGNRDCGDHVGSLIFSDARSRDQRPRRELRHPPHWSCSHSCAYSRSRDQRPRRELRRYEFGDLVGGIHQRHEIKGREENCDDVASVSTVARCHPSRDDRPRRELRLDDQHRRLASEDLVVTSSKATKGIATSRHIAPLFPFVSCLRDRGREGNCDSMPLFATICCSVQWSRAQRPRRELRRQIPARRGHPRHTGHEIKGREGN